MVTLINTVSQLQQLMELQELHNNELKCQVSKLSGDLTNRDAELSRLRDELSQQIKLNRQLEEQRSQMGQVKKQNGKLQEELDRALKKVRSIVNILLISSYSGCYLNSTNTLRRPLNNMRVIRKSCKKRCGYEQ